MLDLTERNSLFKTIVRSIISLILLSTLYGNAVEINRSVQNGVDDAEEASDGTVILNSSDLEMVMENSNQTVGIYFSDITIPQGMIIESAYLQFQVDETSTEETNLTIYAEKSTNPSPFTKDNFNISSRTKSDASVIWTPQSWESVGESGINQQSSDLKTLVQEIVNQEEWKSGNPLTFIITGTGKRVAESYDGSATGSAHLYINYLQDSDGDGIEDAQDSDDDNDGVEDSEDAFPLDATESKDSDGDGKGDNADLDDDNDGAKDSTELALGTDPFDANSTPPVETISIDSQISTSMDDVEELSDGEIYTNSSDLELIQDRTEQIVGLHFKKIEIDKDRLIKSAYIQFQVDETSSETTNLVIYGEKVSNSAPFETTNHNVSERAKTKNSVVWSPESWNTVGSRGTAQQTSDIKGIIQEIITQKDWNNGNAISLIITGEGKRIAESYDGSAENAPHLYISYFKDSEDSDNDGIINAVDSDDDNDGVEDSQDAFPFDATESKDSDGDGMGDNADLDDDNDGARDATELLVGTDPFDSNSTPPLEIKTVELQITSGSADVEELSSGEMYIDSSDLELVQDSTLQKIGLHFEGINISQGMKIKSAYLQFQVDETSNEETNLSIYGERIGDATLFTNETHNLSLRGKTKNSITWNPTAWESVGDADTAQQSSDLITVIQEIVNQRNWDNGQALNLIIEGSGKRVAESYEGSPTGATKLYISYYEDNLDSDGDGELNSVDSDDDNDGIEDSQDAFPLDANESVDTDGDGLGDNADLDDDGDGVWDSREIEEGTDPLNANSTPEIRVLSVSSQISSSTDDAEEAIFHQVNTNSSDLELTYDGEDLEEQLTGLRFTNISIPKGASLVKAYIQFQVDEVSTEETNLTIYGEKALTPLTFEADGYNISRRALTNSSVVWKPSPWNSVGERAVAQQSVDLSKIVQELIDQEGWNSGTLSFIISGTGARVAESYDGSVTGAPKLYISYLEGDLIGDTQAPVLTLNGEKTVEAEVGFYNEQGALAKDIFDGDVPVMIGGTLRDEVGTYTVTYTATDRAGNSSTITRTVVMVPNKVKTAIEGMYQSTALAVEKLNNYTPTQDFSYGKEFFVSTTGDDSNSGTIDAPLASLKGAKEAVKIYKENNGIPDGGIVVWFRGGNYSSIDYLKFTAEDSGESGNPIAYRGYQDEKVRIMGAVPIASDWFKAVDSNDPLWERLDEEAKAHIQVLNLHEHNITNLGTLDEWHYSSNAPMELYDDTKALTLARWPDENQTTKIPYFTDETLTIYGENLVPDVSGTYTQEHNLGSDEDKDFYTYASFKKDELVDGKQYYIRHYKAQSDGVRRTWAITSDNYKNSVFYYSGTGYSIPRDFTRKSDEASGIPMTVPFEEIQFGFASMKRGVSQNSFEYVGDRPSRWKNLEDVWVNGMFYYAWRNYHNPLTSIDTSNRVITMKYDDPLGIQQEEIKRQYYVYNLIEELTTAGEYYIDRNSSNLYYYPKRDLSESQLYVSLNKYYIVDFEGASFVEFHDMALEMGRQDIVRFTEGSHNLLSHLKLRLSGRNLVKFSKDTYDNGVEYSELSESGERAVYLTGGNLYTLKSGNNFVTNNHIIGDNRWSWTSQGAIGVFGAGNIAEHNEIHGFKHQAINFGGNNNSISYNNIYDVLKYTEDAGVIYGGRSWTERGNKIKYNFIHDIKNNYSQQILTGIYFDTLLDEEEVVGNIFYNIDGKGMLQSGGRDNLIENNMFVHVATPFMGMNWSITQYSEESGDSFNMLEQALEYDYKNGIYATMYPKLALLPDSWDELIGTHWLLPEDNIFRNNRGEDNLRWALDGKIESGTLDFAVYEVAEMEPLPRDSDKFVPLPYDEIGIQLP